MLIYIIDKICKLIEFVLFISISYNDTAVKIIILLY